MLLRVTTHGQRVLSCVTDAPNYMETSVTLPPGTYVFRRTPNPFRLDFGDWMVLDESGLLGLGLNHDAIVGMSYEALMFYSSSACGYADMVMDVEDITPVVAVAQPVITTEVRPMNPARQVIHLPIRNYPNFARSDQPRGSNILTLYCAGRHRRFLNPAARRECNG